MVYGDGMNSERMHKVLKRTIGEEYYKPYGEMEIGLFLHIHIDELCKKD